MATMSVQSGWIRTTEVRPALLMKNLTEEKLKSPIYSEHDAAYYEECLANLREKGIEL